MKFVALVEPLGVVIGESNYSGEECDLFGSKGFWAECAGHEVEIEFEKFVSLEVAVLDNNLDLAENLVKNRL